MKNPHHRNRDFGAAVAVALFVLCSAVFALDDTGWKNRQVLAVDRPGLLKIALPPETLGLARAGLDDLRLLDPAGREVPFVFTLPPPAQPAVSRRPASFKAILSDSATQLRLETGTSTAIEFVTLSTPAPSFLKPVRVEVSGDGKRWETIASGTAIFRQFGAEQLRIDLQRKSAGHVRITVSDTVTRPVAFTGATLQLAGSTPPDVSAPISVRVLRRDEFAGESVLTLDLGGANVPLASIEFETTEPLFARAVRFSVRELADESSVERTLASGQIWRVAADGMPATSQREVPVDFTAPSRELFIHVANGDSPPLSIDRVVARQHPVWLVFRAAEAGSYSVLTGNAQVPAPRYDLATLATALRDTPPSPLVPGPAQPNPGYKSTEALADTPLQGAAFDPAPWAFRKPVRLAASGVQQLELDLDVLAHAQAGFSDLRLSRAGAQVPYLLERPALQRSTALGISPAGDPKRPHVSRWQIKLPRAALPITRLSLASPTALFQRQFRLFERVTDERRGETVERALAWASWSHAPGEARPLALNLSSPPATDVVYLETDDGDNPPIVLSSVQASYPVARLLFKSDAAVSGREKVDVISLHYGNRTAAAPRYDLALVARQILTAEKSIASLGAEEATRPDGAHGISLSGSRAGILFWGVLALVVVGLLVVVAKLLPKPPAA